MSSKGRELQRGRSSSSEAPLTRASSVLSVPFSPKYAQLRCNIMCRADPGKFSPIISQIPAKSYLKVIGERGGGESTLWIQLACGWISSKDTNGVDALVEVDEATCLQAWDKEADHRHRVAAAVVGMLTKSHSLENARRVARAMLKHCMKSENAVLMTASVVVVEELLIALGTAVGLRQAEVYEFVKVAACQQSNPRGALVAMCEEIYSMMDMRPTMWVKNNLPVLSTDSMRRNNDQFVMTAARGDAYALQAAIERGQEISVIHSELMYTALHAATEFGNLPAVKMLLAKGMSINIRDIRRGKTALHLAAQSGRSDIAHYLLDQGADRTMKTFKGQVAYEIADEHGNYECREILKFPPPEIQFVQVQ